MWETGKVRTTFTFSKKVVNHSTVRPVFNTIFKEILSKTTLKVSCNTWRTTQLPLKSIAMHNQNVRVVLEAKFQKRIENMFAAHQALMVCEYVQNALNFLLTILKDLSKRFYAIVPTYIVLCKWLQCRALGTSFPKASASFLSLCPWMCNCSPKFQSSSSCFSCTSLRRCWPRGWFMMQVFKKSLSPICMIIASGYDAPGFLTLRNTGSMEKPYLKAYNGEQSKWAVNCHAIQNFYMRRIKCRYSGSDWYITLHNWRSGCGT